MEATEIGINLLSRILISYGYAMDPVLTNQGAYGPAGWVAKPFKSEEPIRSEQQLLFEP